MNELTTETTRTPERTDPGDQRFAAALDRLGARRWADTAFPYDLTGAGTASGGEPDGAAGEAGEAPAQARAAAVTSSAFVLDDARGAVGLIVRPGYLRGEAVPTALLRDLALPQGDPAAARSLVTAAVAQARELGAVVAVMCAPGGDAPLPDLAAGWDGVPAFRRVAEFRTILLVPALWRFEEPEYKVFAATKAEMPALAYLLDLSRQGHAFAPPVDEPTFVSGVGRCPNLKVTDFRIARYKGEMVAMCGVWEPGTALPTTLASPGPAEALFSLAGKALGRLSPFPRLPGTGGALRVRFVRAFAQKQGHPGVLRYLLDRIANETRKYGAHALEITLPADDPLHDLVRGRVRRVRSPAVWAAPLAPRIDLTDLGPVDPGILDPGF